jgi:peptidyl-prolyl cis-trans isomerase SurA
MRRGAWLAAALAVAVLGAAADRRPLDGVVAVVNDDIILASELGEEISSRLYQLGPDAASVGDLAAFTSEVLAAMVDRRLLLQDADAHNIVVTKEDIDPYLVDQLERVRASFGSPENYRAALAKYGLTEKGLTAKFRQDIRDDIKINRLTEEVLAPRVTVPEAELRAYYESRRAALAVPTVVTLREVAVAVRPSPEAAARVRGRLEALRASVRAGADFDAVAAKLAREEGGDYGKSFTFMPGEAVPALEAAAQGLAVGDVSAVTPGGDGYWVVKLVGVKGESREVSYLELPLKAGPADRARARAKADEAAAALARGVPFETVAKDYTESEEEAAAGGLVGEVDLPELEASLPEVAAAVNALPVGGVTPVIEHGDGFFIVKVDARTDGRDVSYEEARDRVKSLVRSQKLADAQREYLSELKAKAYVKMYD